MEMWVFRFDSLYSLKLGLARASLCGIDNSGQDTKLTDAVGLKFGLYGHSLDPLLYTRTQDTRKYFYLYGNESVLGMRNRRNSIKMEVNQN